MKRKANPPDETNQTTPGRIATDDSGAIAADRNESDAERTTFAALVRVAQFHQLCFEQREKDNGIRRWVTLDRLAEVAGCNERTVFETLKRMREDFDLPVHYVAKRKGYGYTEPVTQFPTLVYNRADCLALCIAMQGSAMYAGTGFSNRLRSVIRKLTAGLRKELAVKFESLERVVSFHATGADAFIPLENFEVIVPALIHRQELEIHYATAHREDEPLDGSHDSEPGIRRIEPLHLACIDFGWYLFAYDDQRKSIRTFALRRIKRLRMTGNTIKSRTFNARKKLESGFGAFSSGERATVRIRLWGRAARVIPEFLWHKSQIFEPVPGEPGCVDMTLTVAISPRFVGWLGEWLREIAVLEPVHLRETLITSCEECIANQRRIGGAWDARCSAVL